MPAGVLRPGKHDDAQVSALAQQGPASGSIFAQHERSVTATTFCGVFTP
ncbi:MAG TPA: hypothetical protein VFS43_19370 [Polyangiaceae bacterium]|nr:hypothetical protein [Polyangiaceae bacterium]